MLINGVKFDIDFCKRFSEKKLRLIYKNESEETISELIALVHPKKETVKTVDLEVKEVKPKAKKKN